MEKVKLLVISDFGVATGFARVMTAIVEELPEYYDVYSIAINYRGDYYPTRAKLYPAQNGGDLWGINRVESMVTKIRPDRILILQDSWIIKEYLQRIPEEYLSKVVLYVPVDAGPYNPEWLSKFPEVKQVVAYTEFGKNVLLNANPAIENIKVVPHGTNFNTFYPVDQTEARNYFKSLKDDYFIVLNVNRNQPRKRIDVALKGFALFADGKDDVRYYHHSGIEDAGFNVIELSKRLQIDGKLIVTSLELSPSKFMPDNVLNLLYNSADVGLNTSMGEGWGLCFAPGVRVVTPSGYKNIENVSVGDDVFTASGSISTVTKVYERDYSGTMLKIRASGNSEYIYATPEHPFLTKEGWTKAEDLQLPNYLYRPNLNTPKFNGVFDFTDYGDFSFDDSNIYLTTYSLVGSPIKNKTQLDSARRALNKYVSRTQVRILPRYFKVTDNLLRYLAALLSKRNPPRVSFLPKLLKEIRDFFSYTQGKRHKMPSELSEALLKLAYDLDFYAALSRDDLFKFISYLVEYKHYYKKDARKVWLAARTPEKQEIFEYVLNLVGIPYSQFKIKGDGTKYLSLDKTAIRRFFDDSSRKRDLSAIRDVDLNGTYYRINHLEQVQYTGKVYNLEVEGEHTYLVENIAVHNCNTEHGSTGKTQIVPAHSANLEIYADNRGILMDIDHYDTLPKILTEGGCVAPEEVARKLEYAYYNRDELKEIGKRCYRWLTRPEMSWDYIAKTFAEILK